MLPDFNVKIKKCNVQGYGKNLLPGSVVQKPVNANPGFKVYQGFHFSLENDCKGL